MIIQELFNKNLDSILKIHPKKIAVAVSGGSDSLALTLLTNNWAKLNKVKMVAITVDHNLRKNSAREALKVRKWLEKYNIEHHILTYTGEIPTSNIEAIARNYRYKMLFDYCCKNDIQYLFVAHNADEQTETFFLNLSRGSGVYGLCGMPKIQIRENINIVRPMLYYSKEEIKKYLKSNHQKWVEDPSNKDNKYKRVRIRKLKKLIDTLELSNERIANTLDNMRRAREAIDFFVNDFIFKSTIEKKNESITLSPNLFAIYPEEVVIRAISKILQELSQKTYPSRFENLKNLYNKIINHNLGGGVTLSNLKISTKKDGVLFIEKEKIKGKKTAGKK
ncbi:tRNA lysidine(34) synthetase TilS [bacterium]|nr:tRNA lysidine(34) synthetase TilS [bacterium]